MASRTSIQVFAVANFVLAALAGLCALFWIGILIFGVYFSGDTGEELVAGVIGTGFFLVIAVIYGLLTLAAGIGLLKRVRWGYYFHLVAAAITALSCIGVPYTVAAILFAAKPEFREGFFGEGPL